MRQPINIYRPESGPEQGKLPKFAWPGGYPLFYLTGSDNDVLCPACANKAEENGEVITVQEANWEDASLYCDECSERIESAYAEDDVS